MATVDRMPALYDEKHADQVVRLLDEARRLGALADPSVLALFDALAVSPGDAALREWLNDALTVFRVREAIRPDPLRPYPAVSSGLDKGEIEIATVQETGLPWRVPVSDLPHVLVVGPIGKGKSHCVRLIVVQCAGRIPFVLVTLKDDEARLLVDPPVARYAVRFEELRLALFAPPKGSTPDSWVRLVIELLCRIWGLQYSRALLYECGDRLLALYGRYSQANGKAFAFTPRNLLEAVKQRKSKYLDGIVAALEMLTRSTGEVFECREGYDLEQFLFRRGCVVILSTTYDDRVARFITDFLMEWAFVWLQHNGPNDGSPRVLFALDDAHRFLTAAAEKDGLMPLSHRYLVARQAGLRFVAVSQYPADLAPAVLSQSGIVIQVGGLANLKDVQAIGTALGIPTSGWARLHTSHRGEIVARENLGRYDRPFAGVIVPPVVSGIAFSESDRRRLMRTALSQMGWSPAVPLQVVERVSSGAGAGAMPSRVPGGVSPGAIELARDVRSHPWDFLHVRYTRLGIAGRPAQAAKDELLRLGWVKEHAVPRKGRPPLLLEPLRPLCAALGATAPSWGKGGFLHAFVMHVVVEALKKTGHTRVETEKFLGSKAIDVVATNSAGQPVAVEITISLVNLVDNIEKDFLVQPNWAELTVVCLSFADARQA